jgi:hypothetical protein
MKTRTINIGADCGCFNFKLVGDEGALIFPSLVAPVADKGYDMERPNRFEITYNGRTYALGEDAEARLMGNRSKSLGLTVGDKDTEFNFIKTLGAIARYNELYEDDRDIINVNLGYGSPYTKVHDNEPAIRAFFQNGGNPISFTYNKKQKMILVENVQILPEGVVPSYTQKFEEDVFHICDVGSENINFSTFSRYNGKYMLMHEYSDTASEGTEWYKKRYPNEYLSHLSDAIFSQFASLRWEQGRSIYICGGLTEYLVDILDERSNHKYNIKAIEPTVPKNTNLQNLDSTFANAVGLFIIISALAKAKAKANV